MEWNYGSDRTLKMCRGCEKYTTDVEQVYCPKKPHTKKNDKSCLNDLLSGDLAFFCLWNVTKYIYSSTVLKYNVVLYIYKI